MPTEPSDTEKLLELHAELRSKIHTLESDLWNLKHKVTHLQDALHLLKHRD